MLKKWDDGPEKMDIVTRKVCRLCEADLRHAVETATCGTRLWAILSMYRDAAVPDQQEVEGTNKLVSVLSERAPAATIALISTRVCINKKLGVGHHVHDGPRVIAQRAARLADVLVA